ncbi:zinc finger protein RFP-like isoform X2 [Rhineura floridana]|uniref:zinc finger protein RFP-like isoform X2 n=1 Tax=Rhineura floridana TaxID=261503 RepID=UPI002AC7FC0B|nr:zinc finger protein RFP-like isoform X2 [Rhineura floridana]
METEGPIRELCDEATCSICLEYFKEPVIIDCGHNFCQACLAQYWGEPDKGISCPQCRKMIQQRNFRPNWQLANITEILRKLEDGNRAEGQRGVCEKHQEPLKLFCRDDQASICVVCDRSKEHRDHSVIPVEEVTQLCEEKAELKCLEKEREILVDQKLAEELRSQECLTQLEMEKQKVASAFERMYNFLEEIELHRLAKLGALKKEIEEIQRGNVAKLSEEISHLSNLITEVERNCQQPENEFPQDIRNILSRYEKGQVRQLVELSPGLEEKFRIYSQTNSALEEAMEKYKESLEEALNKVNFTLDPDTANPFLILSEDLKSVRRGSRYQAVPDNPERFDIMMSVLGQERFTSGRHWWEVEVEENLGRWAVGIARESVRRKGQVRISPEEGFWAVGKSFRDSRDLSSPCQILAFTSPKPTPLIFRRKIRKIRVSLSYDEDRVEFSDVDSDDLIFTFHSASFSGEKILPFFRVWRGVRLKC